MKGKQAGIEKNREKNPKGIQCNVTVDPPAFRHGHFHFHHADPTQSLYQAQGREGRKEDHRQKEEKVVEVK